MNIAVDNQSCLIKNYVWYQYHLISSYVSIENMIIFLMMKSVELSKLYLHLINDLEENLLQW